MGEIYFQEFGNKYMPLLYQDYMLFFYLPLSSTPPHRFWLDEIEKTVKSPSATQTMSRVAMTWHGRAGMQNSDTTQNLLT